MNNKILDYVFPVIGGTGGSLLSVITIEGLAQTAVSALIFSFIGAVVGFGVKKALDAIFKKKK